MRSAVRAAAASVTQCRRRLVPRREQERGEVRRRRRHARAAVVALRLRRARVFPPPERVQHCGRGVQRRPREAKRVRRARFGADVVSVVRESFVEKSLVANGEGRERRPFACFFF